VNCVVSILVVCKILPNYPHRVLVCTDKPFVMPTNPVLSLLPKRHTESITPRMIQPLYLLSKHNAKPIPSILLSTIENNATRTAMNENAASKLEHATILYVIVFVVVVVKSVLVFVVTHCVYNLLL